MSHKVQSRIKEEARKVQEKIRLALSKPLTRDNICCHYLPLGGAASYSLLSLSVLNPRLSASIYSTIGLPEDMSTNYGILSVLGLSLHLYNRNTLHNLPAKEAISVYHSGMYVLGSVLGWAILARYLPNNSLLKTVAAFGVSAGMLCLTQSSLDHIDGRLGSTLGRK